MIGDPFLNFNSEHLQQFDASLCRQLISYPQEVIPTFDMAINEMFFDKYPDTALEHQIQVRPFNANQTHNMRSLNPEGLYSAVIVIICILVVLHWLTASRIPVDTGVLNLQNKNT